MEDLEDPSGSPALQDFEEPSGNNDPGDPLNPGIEEEDRPNAPMAEPTADVDAFEDDEAPETVEAMDDAAEDPEDREEQPPDSPGGGDDDEDSELEELDETQFQDFDASALNIPDKPTAVDESNVALLGVHKRKRTEEEERERKKKKREGRREKPKRDRKKKSKDGDEDDDFEGGVEIDGKRARKSKVGADGQRAKPRRARTPEEDNENLTPEERRRRALDKKMDEALKTHRSNRRRGRGIDLEAAADAEIEQMRQRMAKACEADAEARSRGNVATHKLAILPQVVELMNRNTIQQQLVDPDINILEAVRFMLEPADHDAALPNYRIQRELFAILGRLNIGKEALVASGIGKVVLFYTKSTQPQPEIKRQAEKLIGEWMRVVLHKRKDQRGMPIQTKSYDPIVASQSQLQNPSRNTAAVAAERRKKALAQPIPGNRARPEGGVDTYTIAPVNNLSNALGVQSGRKMGASGEDAFRKIAARGAVKGSKTG